MDYEIAMALRHTEIWITVKETSGRQPTKCEISSFGRRGKILLNSGKISNFDYGATNNNGYKVFGHLGLAHQVIARAFIANPHNKPFINHINGNKHDNNVSNLEWVTNAENIQHAYNTGLIDSAKISKSLKGRNPDNYDPRIHCFKNVLTNQIVKDQFWTLKRNAKDLLGISDGSVCNLKEGKRQQVKNWIYLGVELS